MMPIIPVHNWNVWWYLTIRYVKVVEFYCQWFWSWLPHSSWQSVSDPTSLHHPLPHAQLPFLLLFLWVLLRLSCWNIRKYQLPSREKLNNRIFATQFRKITQNEISQKSTRKPSANLERETVLATRTIARPT